MAADSGSRLGGGVLGRRVGAACLLAVAALAFSGCRVQVNKDANGKEKTVHVDTPFGGVHVNTNQTTATDLGLPEYPGAHAITDDEKHKSADVHLGFGDWQIRVKAVSYGTSDGRDKVAAFYKKALGRYGDVLTCQGNSPVGTPTVTHEGLGCSDDGAKGHVHIESDDLKRSFELRAGSKRHQHIVGFEDNGSSETRFTLVAIDLPGNLGSDEDKQ